LAFQELHGLSQVSDNEKFFGTGVSIWGVPVRNLGIPTDFPSSCPLYRAEHQRRKAEKEERVMPRYVAEREFPDGLLIPTDENGARACLAVVESNLSDHVTWIHSYVSTDKKKTFCVYDAPSPEAIRRTANRNKLPVACVTEVRVLDPYFYK
jgi:hypothetical protein